MPSLVLGARTTIMDKTDSPLLRDRQKLGGCQDVQGLDGAKASVVGGPGQNGTQFTVAGADV